MIHLAIVGSRNMNNHELFNQTMQEFISTYGVPSLVISGGADGADSLGEKWARKMNIPLTIYYPEWTKYGKAAGILRNTDIVQNCTHMIAFPSSKGKGTQDSIKKAQKFGKILIIKPID